jgi:hypothetical protein
MRQRFNPSTATDWQSYLEFSGFYHVTEIITIDEMLCPSVVTEITAEDWNHNVNQDFRLDWFTDAEYLKKRVNVNPQFHNLIALLEHPHTTAIPPPHFEHCGFDILDGEDSISVLTKCGQFPEIFSPSSVNQFSLLDSLSQAHQIAEAIRKTYPDEYHCQNCRVWQIARYLYSYSSLTLTYVVI